MPAAALELNDAGLVLLREGAASCEPDSPGVALFEGGTVLVGAAARARERQLPSAVHDRFWDPLGTELLGARFPAGLRRADVAHAHLRSLRGAPPEAPDAVVIAVPGFWERPALGLLLSVARSAGLPVVGLVDAAVVAAAGIARAGEQLHLDLTRHRCVLTRLQRSAAVERCEVAHFEGSGLLAAERALVEAIARRFVLDTRFDPLHSGASEQTLLDRLPAWLTALRGQETCPARLEAGRRAHTIELSRGALASDLEPFYRSLLRQLSSVTTPAATPLLVSARAARLPGLLDRLRSEGAREPIELPHDAAVATALRFRASIAHAGEALPLVTRLPVSGSTDRGAGRRPTHLMNGGVAHPLAGGLAIGTAPPAGRRGLGLRQPGVAGHHCSLLVDGDEVRLEIVPGATTLLNGVPAEDRTRLVAGDRLGLGSSAVVLQLVAVEDRA